ncbi:hypothetical protein GE21DRAFT_1869 [Neurospora crassa]|uniref:Uncharacterized protein n=1 Tax=Neurospora crassa (strain ATCC 24698 / 74-OR23-1A / CBS 708.71 / DSM 1257 / FGSC 987) TaxID=367110 RepID=Q7SD99_NEUCR|nr:hypothetical protein NCU00840 [Neurospora crassa OR74A]EAA34724.1 hypothetical protein NCU00840 [Neurospora crassa OR74A]KHE78613.1 hypothetical protein GE21DRAFT_1869 [Neurospora crassa]|eukprot:XP_963960.1 hypothetical protein NCU00840 [Neurospora crassa OR74A]
MWGLVLPISFSMSTELVPYLYQETLSPVTIANSGLQNTLLRTQSRRLHRYTPKWKHNNPYQPHNSEVMSTINDGSASQDRQPGKLEANHGRLQAEPTTSQAYSSLIAENQRLEAKIQELLSELSKRTQYIDRQKDSLAKSATKAYEYKRLATCQKKEVAGAKERHLKQQGCATIRVEGFKPINRRDQSEDHMHAPQKQQAEAHRTNELERECNNLKIQLIEVEKNWATERQAATERVAKLEAEYDFLREENKQTENSHHDALNKCKRWKDCYHEQLEKMKVLQEKHEQSENQLNIAKHELKTKAEEARIADSDREAASNKLKDLERECKQLKEQLTVVQNERNYEQQAATNKVSEMSKECGRLKKQIIAIQSESAAKVEEALNAQRDSSTRTVARIEEERGKLKEQVATAQEQLATQAKKALEAEVKEKNATKRVTELEERCKALEKQLSTCETRLDEEAAAFTVTLKQVTKRKTELEEECSRLRETMTADKKNASDKIFELKKECQIDKEKAAKFEQKFLEYQNQAATIECQLEAAITSGERSRDQLATTERQLAIKTEEVNEVNVKLQNAGARINELEEAQKPIEKEISTLKGLLSLATSAKKYRTAELEQASMRVRELQQQNNHLRREQIQTAAAKAQAIDQCAKLKAECDRYQVQVNNLEEKHRRYSKEVTRLEQECLGHQKRITTIEGQLEIAVELDNRSRASVKLVDELSQKIAALKEECRQYALTETNENDLAVIPTRLDATGELAALRDAVNNGLSRKAQAGYYWRP